jgi:hypothetical protein
MAAQPASISSIHRSAKDPDSNGSQRRGLGAGGFELGRADALSREASGGNPSGSNGVASSLEKACDAPSAYPP